MPEFKPSRRVDQTSSAPEAWRVCAEYEITSSPARVSALVPWLDCVEDVFRKFPNARKDKGAEKLYFALQSRYSSAPAPATPVIDGPDMNFAVRRALEHLADPSLPYYTVAEGQAVGRELPLLWHYLFEHDQINTLAAARGLAGAAGSALREEATLDARELPPRPQALSDEQREYCRRYLGYLKSLYSAETRAPSEHEELDASLRHLQATSAWFQNGYCLSQGPARLIRRP